MNKKSLIAEIKQMKKEYIADNGTEPQEIYVNVVWQDGDTNECQTIRMKDESEVNDDEVLYYCGSWKELYALCKKNSFHDFRITDVLGMDRIV